jgi:hypothetical protein
MDFNRPTGKFATQGELIQAWEKDVEKKLNEFPATQTWKLEETDIQCPTCASNLYRCYVYDPHKQKIYGEANLLYCDTDKAFYNETNIVWQAINGKGGGGGTASGSIVQVIDGVLTITDA